MAQVVTGKAFGFGEGATGGGNAKAATPSSIKQLQEWLADDVPVSNSLRLAFHLG